MPVIVTIEGIAEAQATDQNLQEILISPSSLKLHKLRLYDSEVTIYCDVSTEGVRPYIPDVLRRKIFDAVHRLSHPGIRATRQLITQRFIWPDVNKQVAEWVRTCLQ